MDCAPNTCRVNFRCYCPGRFLSSESIQRDCADSFLKVWPQSISEEDRHWRSCDNNFEPPTGSIRSCCEMTDDELEALVGTSDNCPSTSFVSLSAKCLPCPPGTCRVNFRCLCPSEFWDSSSRQRDCADSFGEPWPNSIGMEDTDWRSCNSSSDQSASAEGSTADGGTSTDEGISGAGESDDNQGSTGSGTTSVASTSAGANSGGSNPETTINIDGSSNVNAGEPGESSLTTLEIVGIVAGVVSAIVTVVGGLAALRKRKKNRDQEEYVPHPNPMAEKL
ncbi:hypothetical protein FGB62_312g014 [Gracilaria domingensis]|nr:hypothetical protein FGB62_312g014 [Gracilaria domingensis]